MAHLLVAGLASVGVFLIWFALAREYVEVIIREDEKRSNALPDDCREILKRYAG